MDTIVGIDVGYGYTKSVSNQRQATMRSVIGPALQIKYHNDLISNGQGLEVQLGDKVWFLGELARLQSPFTISPRARERDAEVVRPLLLGALYQLGHRAVAGSAAEPQRRHREVIREAIRAKTRPQSTLDTAVLRRVLREELARLTVTSRFGTDWSSLFPLVRGMRSGSHNARNELL